MGTWVDKLERKIGRFAIPHLMRYIIIIYGLGLILEWTAPEVLFLHYICIISLEIRWKKYGARFGSICIILQACWAPCSVRSLSIW